MLSENIKNYRKSKGYSQEDLAIKLNVVRQTVSKWEQGLSVPDAEMLIMIADTLDTSVSSLLGETSEEQDVDELKAISERLEVVNLQLAKMKETKRKKYHIFFIILLVITVLTIIGLFFYHSAYLDWDDSNSEYVVIKTLLHAFEFAFVRLAPFILFVASVGIIQTRKKQD